MSDILQEIDDAMKREKAEKFWKENGPTLVISAIALVVFTGVFAGWNTYKLKVNTRQTGLLISALETQFPETALDAVTPSLKGSHKAIAMMQSAGIKAQGKTPAAAIALYRDIAADRSTPAMLRDLAILNAVILEWEGGADAAKSRTLLGELKPVTNAKDPWGKQASVQAALIAGDGLQDYKAALEYLATAVNDPATPPKLKERAMALEHIYTMKAAQNRKAVTKTEAAPVTAEPKG